MIELRVCLSSSIKLVVIPVSYVQAMCELAVKFVVPSNHQSIISLNIQAMCVCVCFLEAWLMPYYWCAYSRRMQTNLQ